MIEKIGLMEHMTEAK